MDNTARHREIDALALKGHEALLAELKADPSVTPGAAALRIAAAEKARRTPTAAVLAFSRHTTADMAGQMARWRAEWAASPALQREFVDAEVYAHFKWAVATGRTRADDR